MSHQFKSTFSGALIIAITMAFTVTSCTTQKQDSAGEVVAFSGSTNYLGQTLPVGSLTPGSATCLANYCTFLTFNHAGVGFTLSCTPAYITFKVNGEVLSTSSYEIQWRYGALKKGCVSNFSSTQKQYANVVGKKYTFTVYFREPCPQPGSTVEIIIECGSSALSTEKLRVK